MTGTLRFTKGHGTRNDFVLLFDPGGRVALDSRMAAALCDRRSGIGGDGVIRAVRAGNAGPAAAAAVAGADPAAWFMDYLNADGSTSEMCGNGARVFGALLERDGGEDLSGGLEFITRGGPRTVTALGGGDYAIGMGPWRLADDAAVEVEAPGMVGPRRGVAVDVGNPHVVVPLDSEDELAALDLTAPPRLDPAPPAGANVEFVVALPGDGAVRMRVHERGSGETQSCGTGACAAALAARHWAGAGAPDVWTVAVPGGTLTIRIADDHTVLEGPAVLVADGDVDLASL